MQWRRGFIRLWLVASFIWGVAVVADNWSKLHWWLEYTQYTEQRIEKAKDRAVVLSKEGDEEARQDAKVLAMTLAEKRASNAWLLDTAKAVIIPPITILCLGLLVSWIISGFRSKSL
jgi:hypothetical protein